MENAHIADLLQEAFTGVAKLSPEHQDAIASIVLSELGAQRAWSDTFGANSDALANLADGALTEEERGETADLDLSGLSCPTLPSEQ